MYAVIETGGKQIKVEAGRFVDIEKLPMEKGDKVTLEKVLMLISGKDSTIGTPYIAGANVKGEVLEQGKEDKVIVYKMRPKKGTRKKTGHRQRFTRVLINSIELNGKVLAKSDK